MTVLNVTLTLILKTMFFMPKDVAFGWPELREGLKKRKETEMKLMRLQSEVRALAFSN